MLRKIYASLESRLFPASTTIVRLEASVLESLHQKVNASAVVTSQTTDLMAGYQLGVNHVLNILRTGYTITRS